MSLTAEQVMLVFGRIRERVLPVEKLKIELADKEYKAGFKAGYDQAYRQIMGCESDIKGRIAMAANERAKRERENAAKSHQDQ